MTIQEVKIYFLTNIDWNHYMNILKFIKGYLDLKKNLIWFKSNEHLC